MPTYDRQTLIAELTRDEGLRLKPYRDTVGKLTIGVGRNLDDAGISTDEADYLLGNDITRVESWLDQNVPWWESLDPVRQRVLANMAFNLGNRLLGFRMFLAAAHQGNWSVAAAEMLNSKWATQVGDRATRLADMMRTGQ